MTLLDRLLDEGWTHCVVFHHSLRGRITHRFYKEPPIMPHVLIELQWLYSHCAHHIQVVDLKELLKYSRVRRKTV